MCVRMQVDNCKDLGSNYMDAGKDGCQLEHAWQQSLAAEGYQDPRPHDIALLFNRHLHVKYPAWCFICLLILLWRLLQCTLDEIKRISTSFPPYPCTLRKPWPNRPALNKVSVWNPLLICNLDQHWYQA